VKSFCESVIKDIVHSLTMNKESKKEKSKVGRPRKKISLPQTTMINALDYTKRIYDRVKDATDTLNSIAKNLGISEMWARKVSGEMEDYGLIERDGIGWRVTNLGSRAAKGEKNAVIEVLQKNSIMWDLFNEFKEGGFTPELLEETIKRKYPTATISTVARRFEEICGYIDKLKEGKEGAPLLVEPKAEWFKIIQLKYALTPPEKEEITDLAKKVSEELKNHEDVSIKVLANRMKQNLEDTSALKFSTDSIVDILSEKYPSFFKFKEGEKKPSEKEAKEEQ
jgi:DNA-binding Lrp family transcriptional regulator